MRQHFVPGRLRASGKSETRAVRHVNGTGLRVVALEMRGLDVDTMHNTRCAEPDHTPVVPRLAPPTCFPSVHPFATVGVKPVFPDWFGRGNQAILPTEKFIVRGDDRCTESL